MPWFEVQLTVTGGTDSTTALTSDPVILPRGIIEQWYVTPTNSSAVNIWFLGLLDEVVAFPRNRAPNLPFTWCPPWGRSADDHYEALEKNMELKVRAYNLAQDAYTIILSVFVNTAKLREKERRTGHYAAPTEVSTVKQPQPT